MADIEELYRLFVEKTNFTFSIDSRTLIAGNIFVALKGDNFDGSDFIDKALEKGASYIVTQNRNLTLKENFILVEDCLQTLQELAKVHLNHINSEVLAIAGSNGKTTTKEFVYSLLSSQYLCYATPGNYNNHIGVPLTILGTPTQTEILILELGTNSPGEIEFLCELCQPSMGIITNIGKEHLEGFGSIDAVLREETALFNYLIKNNGHAFLNLDDPYLKHLDKRLVNFTPYGFEKRRTENKIRLVKSSPFIEILADDVLIQTKFSGVYNAQNLLAAITIARHFDINFLKISHILKDMRPTNNRSEWIKTKNNTIFLDAYNANPSSMEASIKLIKDYPYAHKLLILGDMFELGKFSDEEHRNIIELTNKLNLSAIFIGKNFYKFKDLYENHLFFEEKKQLENYWQTKTIKNSVVLIKGSRGMRMEELVKFL